MSDLFRKYHFDHPWLVYATSGRQPITFVFEKPHYSPPDQAKLKKYREDAKIVSAHNGRMLYDERSACCEPIQSFTVEEVEAIKATIAARFPKLQVIEHWNGAGCWSLSVGARERS